MRPFDPIVSDPHLLTILGNFWPRRRDLTRFPETLRYYLTEPDVQVLVKEQSPSRGAIGELILVHGLEGSSEAGYMRSLAQAAVEAGFRANRLNMRSCGGTDHLCRTLYHAGLTADLRHVIESMRAEGRGPIYIAGFSLGANVVLKLAGELGEQGPDFLAGVCAVSTPIDLNACVMKMSEGRNRLYEWRFLVRLKERYRRRQRAMPALFPYRDLDKIRTVYTFDDQVTARAFGFGTADNYYATQSSLRFLPHIQVPTLLVQAKDDPLIPFRVFDAPAISQNPHIRLLAVEHGGHLGFLSRTAPRFWLDAVVVDWLSKLREQSREGIRQL